MLLSNFQNLSNLGFKFATKRISFCAKKILAKAIYFCINKTLKNKHL